MPLFADFHIHLGMASGRPVKITASRLLTLDNIITGARQKGLGMVGLIDAGCLGALAEIENKLEDGEWYQLAGGGWRAHELTIIPGCELETCEGVHVLAYFPDWGSLREFCRWWHPQVTNPSLSTQRGRMSMKDTMIAARSQGGVFGFAHAFTPHKGVYGHYTERLAPVLAENTDMIDFIELGLSADAGMANSIIECRQFAYLSNSDAHSIPNLAREYNRLDLERPDFNSLQRALAHQGQGIMANYGLHPLLGKYYRTYCPLCNYIVEEEPPVASCPRCQSNQVVMGVKDRITMIADLDVPKPDSYHYRVPLLMIPGIGNRTAQRLMEAFGSELAVQEEVPIDSIEAVAGARVAKTILGMRRQALQIVPGGGGRYGHLAPNS